VVAADSARRPNVVNHAFIHSHVYRFYEPLINMRDIIKILIGLRFQLSVLLNSFDSY